MKWDRCSLNALDFAKLMEKKIWSVGLEGAPTMPLSGARAFGELRLIARRGTEFPISISAFTACYSLTIRFLKKLSDLGNNLPTDS